MGYPVNFDGAVPRALITPKISTTYYGSITVAATRGTGQVGMMDTTPTEAEVLALQQAFLFEAVDDVRHVLMTFVAGKPASSAVLAILAVAGGAELDDATAAQALAAGYPNVVVVVPNVPTRLSSNAAITKLYVVAVPSGITSANHEGQRFYVAGASNNA